MSDTTDGAANDEADPLRDQLGVGGPVFEEKVRVGDNAGVQDAPAMDVDDHVPDEAKIEGILAQTRADVAGEDVDRVAEVLRQRFSDAGMTVSDDDVRELAARVVS